MKRHAKTLQAKAKKNLVTPGSGRGEFLVTSSTSGKRYTVKAHADNTFTCCCRWSQYHDTRRDPCSHVLAVMEWLEQSGARALSFWDNTEDLGRQHRRAEQIGRGLWASSRKG